MLKDALEFVRNLSVDSFRPEIKEVPGMPGKLAQLDKNGIVLVDQLPAHRRHKVRTVSDFIAAFKRWGEDAGVVFFNEQEVVLVLDDERRFDRVTLALEPSAEFVTLEGLDNGDSLFAQADFIRLIKHSLHHVVEQSLVAVFRQIDFSRTDNSSGNMRHGGESFGRKIEAQVQQLDQIPEQITATVAPYLTEGAHTRRPVLLSLMIHPQLQKFQLKPLPDELARATAAAMQELGETLGEEIPTDRLFYGEP